MRQRTRQRRLLKALRDLPLVTVGVRDGLELFREFACAYKALDAGLHLELLDRPQDHVVDHAPERLVHRRDPASIADQQDGEQHRLAPLALRRDSHGVRAERRPVDDE
jgi:hypothetical protein